MPNRSFFSCLAVILALGLMRCSGSPASSVDTEVLSASASVDTSDVDPYASTVREVRVQGMYMYSFEASLFKPCGWTGPTLWLDAPGDFWQQLYAFSPPGTIEQTDLSEEVFLDVTAVIQTLDGPHRNDPRPYVGAMSGYGHGMRYKGRIQVQEVHSMQLVHGDDSTSNPSCP